MGGVEKDERDVSLPMMRDVVQVVCRVYGCSPLALSSESRDRELMEPRSIVYLLSRDLCRRRFRTIGYYFYRDHSSISNLVKATRARLSDGDEAFREIVAHVSDEVQAIHQKRLELYGRFASTLRRKRQVYGSDAPRL